MKFILINSRRIILLCVLAALAAASAQAQDGKLLINNLDKLADQAVETVDVTIDENLLKLAIGFLKPERSADEKLAKEIIQDLKGVYVKRFVFETIKEYADSDVEAIRSQLDAPGWSRVVGVRSKRSGANVDVHIMTDASVIKGLAVLVVEPKALTVVNVVGPIDVYKLSRLEGQFGIPKLDLEQTGDPSKGSKQP